MSSPPSIITKTSHSSALSTPISHPSTLSVTSSVARGRKWMKLLCWIELILAIFALTLGSACTGINAGHDRMVCTFGTGIWVGLLSLICAAVGSIAIQTTPYQQKLLILYFIMCVLGALASVVLLAISSMWIEKASKFYNADSADYQLASIALNVCLLIAAVCQTICTFLSAVLLAHYYWGWCCRSSDFNSSIAYVRAEDVADSTTSHSEPMPHLHVQTHDPYYANAIRASENEAYANGNKYFY